jgi:phosphate transport system substrate-binding protein
MKKYKIVFIALALVSIISLWNCKNKTDKETILDGNATVLVDESLLPLMEEHVEIFEDRYPGKIKLIAKSENEIIEDLAENKFQIAVLARKLNSNEEKVIISKNKIKPKQTVFARDAIAIIGNKKNNDTIMDSQTLINLMQNKSSSKYNGLVFENPNSNTMNYFLNLAQLKEIPSKNVFSVKNNNQVIDYVSNNQSMLGVVGLNWLQQTDVDLSNIQLYSIKDLKSNSYIYPSQQNIGLKTYPLARDLHIINCQGFSGLGMGFASFVAGDVGQRIILKAGLLPAKMPSRNIVTRKNIEKK